MLLVLRNVQSMSEVSVCLYACNLMLVILFCSHGNKELFSCLGIQLAVDWFLEKGHKDITVFVPAWRKEQSRPDAPIKGTTEAKGTCRKCSYDELTLPRSASLC